MTKKLSKHRFKLEQLEQRLLLSATLESAAPDIIPSPADSRFAAPVLTTPLLSDRVQQNPAAQYERHEIIFVDAGVPDYQQFVHDLSSDPGDGRRIDVVVLDSSRNGIVQISETLARHQGIDAVHVVSHGNEGAVQLGNVWLTLDTIDAYAEYIEGWGDAVTGEADLLFYGCNLASGAEGQALISSLTFLTGADVAASDDATGHASLGGDWDLEYRLGKIETAVAAGLQVQHDWFGLMAVAVDNVTTATGTSITNVSHTTSGTEGLMLIGVSISTGDPDRPSSMSYNGVALTQVGVQTGTGQNRMEIWSLVAPDIGTHNLTINWSGEPSGASLGIITFTGVDQTTPLGTFASATGSGTSGSVNVTSAAGELVFGSVMVSASNQDLIPGGSQTEQWDIIGGSANGGGSTEVGAPTVTTSWSWTSSANWAIGGVSIKPANNSPTLDNSASPVLDSIGEDSGAPSGAVGTLVSSLVDFPGGGGLDNVTDPDTSPVTGIAITAVDTSNGSWYYSTNNGSNWYSMGSVSNGSARLLAADSNTRVYFRPNSDYYGTISSALTFRAWDQTTGSNGDSGVDTSTNGGSTAFSSATDTASITVTAVNDAPAGADKTVTTLEDTDYTFTTADFGFTDPNDAPGNNLTGVKITTLPGAGTLYVDADLDGVVDAGEAVTAGATVAVADITASKLKFKPAGDANGAGYASFTFQVQDDGGTVNGGVDLDQSPNTMTIDVTSVNDAPTATNLTQLKAYTEGDASVALDNIVVSELDTSPAQTITATLTLNNTA
ncbi:MAG: DUF4347 domain-containing protein, partial [Candidatus Zixiibacteriota bacterium]